MPIPTNPEATEKRSLNFIEQMNIARIQGEEAKPDALRKRVTEEAPGIHGALK